MGKIIALCCLTIIYFLSDKTAVFFSFMFLFFCFFFPTGLVTYLMGLLWGIKSIYVKD